VSFVHWTPAETATQVNVGDRRRSDAAATSTRTFLNSWYRTLAPDCPQPVHGTFEDAEVGHRGPIG
jgi:hypothetical protein